MSTESRLHPGEGMRISLIAALARNGTIGRHNDIPWRIREDTRFFRRTTLGRTVITGRLNYEAMGKPLPKRTNIVITRNQDFQAPCLVVDSLPAALSAAESSGEAEAMIIGGAQIYALALRHAHCFYRTRVLAEVDGDVHFPPFAEHDWLVTELFAHPADEENEFPFVVERLDRKLPPAPWR